MNVIREDVDGLNAILKVQVTPEDYQDKVESALQNYRKRANIPGFRPGKVPMGMLRKQYGPSVLAEELNKVVNDSLYKYITDNNIEILGNPLPKEDAEVKADWKNPSDFEFIYEIGLSPEFDVKLSGRNKYDYVKVKVDKELVDKQLDDLRRRYGKLVSSDKVSDTDLVLGQFVELNEDGEIKEGGVLHSSTVSMEFIEDKKVKKSLTGKKVGDVVKVDPSKLSKGPSDMAAMLGVKTEELEGISNAFQFTVNEVKGMELAELNTELFDKLFGEGAVKDEKEARERISADLEGMFANDSDRILTRSVTEDLVTKTKMELPDAFLKRWIKASNKEEISNEDIDREYDGYAKSLKWQLIQGKLFKDNDINLGQEEALEYTKGLLVNQYAQYGMPAPEDKELTESAQKVLQNREEANRVYDMLGEQKLMHYFKNTVKLTEKEVSYDEFVKIASGEQKK